jgi:hypothetical protein
MPCCDAGLCPTIMYVFGNHLCRSITFGKMWGHPGAGWTNGLCLSRRQMTSLSLG